MTTISIPGDILPSDSSTLGPIYLTFTISRVNRRNALPSYAMFPPKHSTDATEVARTPHSINYT